MAVSRKKTTKAKAAKMLKKPAAKPAAKKAKKAKKSSARKAVAKTSPAKKTVKKRKKGRSTPANIAVVNPAASTPTQKMAWKISPEISQSVVDIDIWKKGDLKIEHLTVYRSRLDCGGPIAGPERLQPGRGRGHF